MELVTLYKRVVGLDVHQAKIAVCAIIEDETGDVTVELAEFGGFKIAMMALDGGRIGISSQAIGIARAALRQCQQQHCGQQPRQLEITLHTLLSFLFSERNRKCRVTFVAGQKKRVRGSRGEVHHPCSPAPWHTRLSYCPMTERSVSHAGQLPLGRIMA